MPGKTEGPSWQNLRQIDEFRVARSGAGVAGMTIHQVMRGWPRMEHHAEDLDLMQLSL